MVKAMVFTVVMYGCESWTIKKLSTNELMLLNGGISLVYVHFGAVLPYVGLSLSKVSNIPIIQAMLYSIFVHILPKHEYRTKPKTIYLLTNC